MRSACVLAVLALGALGAACLAAAPAPASNKNAHHPFHGVVVAVHHHKGKGHGTITVRHEQQEKTFQVNAHTTFEVANQGKGGRGTHGTNLSHVHKGTLVRIHHDGHHATDVKIVHHHAQTK